MSRQPARNARTARRDVLIAGGTNSLNRRAHSASSEGAVRGSISTSCLASPGIRRRGQLNVSCVQRPASPLTLPMPMENIQSMNAAYSMNQTFLGEGLGNAMPSSSSASPSPRSPYHTSSSGITSRSGSSKQLQEDFIPIDPYPPLPSAYQIAAHQGTAMREHSIERVQDPTQRYYATYSGRDRSLDRSQLQKGARSWERDQSNLMRSRSIDHEYMADQAVFFPPAPDVHHNTKDMLILDLQARIAQLNKECAVLGEEVKATKEKLNSSMNSIKTFWSPELKKERATRKEDVARCQAVSDQLMVLEAQYESAVSKQALQQPPWVGAGREPSPGVGGEGGEGGRRHGREMTILRQTVEEMELRIDTQKQTLSARDESVRKLLEMLQGRGAAGGRHDVRHDVRHDAAEMERLRTAAGDEQRRATHLESLLQHKERDVKKLTEDLRNSEIANQVLSPLQKNSQIECLQQQVATLEKELRQRDEVDSSAVSQQVAPQDSLQVETLISQERLLKAKFENVRAEVARKDVELYSLRSQVETWQRQGSDHQQHIHVLREQIDAKEQQTAMLQGDVELLQVRVKEKDSLIQQKGQQCITLQNEKKKLELDVTETRDYTAISERKLSVLHRKVENVVETLTAKEEELATLQTRMSMMNTNNDTSSCTITNLEEALTSKEKLIDRLKEQQRLSDEEHQEEMTRQQTSVRQLKSNADALQRQLQQAQTELLSLQEEMSELRSEKLKRESEINHLQISESQKATEVVDLQQRLKTLEEQRAGEWSRASMEAGRRADSLQQEVEGERVAGERAQAEIHRLLTILKQSEDEKRALDQQIQELGEQLKDVRQKVGAQKRLQQLDKSKHATMLEEARVQATEAVNDHSNIRQLVIERGERIEELEEALRESVRITAQREMVLVHQTEQLKLHEQQAESVTDELERLKQTSHQFSSELCQVSQQLEAKESSLQYLELDRQQERHEVYEMKQEAILAAISEKDAHIGLLEMVPNSNQKNIAAVEQLTREKIKLQKQLKEVTDNRMKLMLENSSPNTSLHEDMKNDRSSSTPANQSAGIWT